MHRRSRRTLIIASLILLAAAILFLWLTRRTPSIVPATPQTNGVAQRDRPSTAVAHILDRVARQTVAERVMQLRRDAAAGDPVAMREVAELILRCGFGTSHGAALWSQVEWMTTHMKAEQVPLLRAAAARREAQCEQLPGTRHELALQYRQLLHSAAEKGDLLARLRQRGRAYTVELQDALPDDAAALVDDALLSNDPRALYAMAHLYTLYPRAPVQSGIGASRQDNPALVLLACERGMDCGVGSDDADSMCLSSGECAEGFDTMMWRVAEADGTAQELRTRMQWLRTMLDEVDRGR